MTRTFNSRIVIKTMGVLLLIEAAFMLLPTIVSWYYDEADFRVFRLSTCITLAAGIVGTLFGHHADKRVGEREGYLIVGLVWIVFSVFGMLPFYLSGAVDTITDAFFETMAGFTTTGATILPDVEIMTHGILFWRALSQWLGGMGIIVLSVAVLPMFGLGGMQLYAAEVTGVNYEKLSPRIADTAKLMWGLYLLMTVVEAVLLCLFGMEGFDAVCHSLSTIATGGFSTKNTSLTEYGAAIHYTVAVFMFLSGINFTLLLYPFMGKVRNLLRDEETHWYAGVVALGTLVLFAGLYISRPYWTFPHAERAFRDGLFMTISAVTSTGFTTSDYMTWPLVLWVIVFFLMFTGACAGSTSGGIKWVRLSIIIKNGLSEFKRRIHPNAIIPVKLNGKPIPQQTISNIMAFMIFYVLIIIVTVLLFCAFGVAFDEAIGTTVSVIGNVGISIGQFGPSGTYAAFPTMGKWVMMFVMLIGRLEIFTVLLLFSPALWKK